MQNALPPEIDKAGVLIPEALPDDAIFRRLDRLTGTTAARATGGLSPVALFLAYIDWSLHLALAPGRRIEMAGQGAESALKLAVHAGKKLLVPGTEDVFPAPQGDNRFNDPAWKAMPFALWQQGFLALEGWWDETTRAVPGLAPHHQKMVAFGARQWLDAFSPANILTSNPVASKAAVDSSGQSLLDGAANLSDDLLRQISGSQSAGGEAFAVGRDLATTPGKVIFRNHLIELIQYAPMTGEVRPEPILIVPAWIMKFYILDLSPENSLIRHLVAQGFTVFCISWRNVGPEDRDLSFDNYRELGVMAALDAIDLVMPGRKVHAAGYCLGGTLLAYAAAGMAGTGDARLGSLTLLAAQTDFSEPGELQIFIDESQVAFLESVMEQQGYLDQSQMAGAFQLLRSNDLVWSHLVQEYLLGRRAPMIDLLAWNQDATRMPARMHSEYLRRLFLGNDLASGRMTIGGRAIAIQNIQVPLFVVGTERDHIAPWRSVYKIHYLGEAPVTFVLTNGGHNAGIVNPPGHPRRHFRHATQAAGAARLGADEWLLRAEQTEGSWWPCWCDWLGAASDPDRTVPPAMGAPTAGLPPLGDAPGEYVMQP